MLSFTFALLLQASPIAPPATPDPAPAYLVADVTVLPLDTDEVLAHRDVIIRDGRIAAIEAAGAARPAGIRVVEGRGRFLVPGFVDAHVHLATEAAARTSRDPALASLDLGDDDAYHRHVLLTLLKAGVTGVANLGGGPASDADLLRLRTAIAQGRLPGPRLFVGKRINGPRAAFADARTDAPASTPSSPTTPADGIAAVREAKARGYDFIKPYQFLDLPTYRAVVDEARRLGMPTTGHLPELGCTRCADRASVLAHPPDNLAHTEELVRYAQAEDLSPAAMTRLADAVQASGSGVTPTLVTLATIVHMYVEREVPAVPAAWRPLVDPVTRRDWDPPHNRYLGQAFREQPGADRFPAGLDFARLLTRELWKRGVPLTVGTDAPLPGLPFGQSVHREMLALRGVGLPPLEVLRAASRNAHRLFGTQAQAGAIRVGQAADLVLLDADPLADLRNTARVAGVFAAGRWWSQAEIDAQLARTTREMDAAARRLRRTDPPR